MKPLSAAFAIPGDIATLTGGYIYERRLLLGLRALGHDVEHIELAASFPGASKVEMKATVARLKALDPGRGLILDGLVFGAVEGLEDVTAPIFAMVHHPLALETGLDPATRDHFYRTERHNLTLAHHVLVPSPHTASILQDQYAVSAERISIALPGTDKPVQQPAPTDPPLILSVGLQHPRKGHDVLLGSLAELSDLSWRCVIVGRAHDTDHAGMLARMVAELGLSDRVTLAGTVSQDALETIYSQATVFALATRYEGYGIVFDEALVRGLPVVTCHTGAVPDTVPQDAGLLSAPDDPVAFAANLRQVLTNEELRMSLSQAALRAGNALPSWEDTARKVADAMAMMQ